MPKLRLALPLVTLLLAAFVAVPALAGDLPAPTVEGTAGPDLGAPAPTLELEGLPSVEAGGERMTLEELTALLEGTSIRVCGAYCSRFTPTCWTLCGQQEPASCWNGYCLYL